GASDSLTYEITLTNLTDATLYNIGISDQLTTVLNDVGIPVPNTNYSVSTAEPSLPNISIETNTANSSAIITIPEFPAAASQILRVTITLNGYNYQVNGILRHEAAILRIEDEIGALGTAALRLPQGLAVNYYNGFEVATPRGNALIPAANGEIDLT